MAFLEEEQSPQDYDKLFEELEVDLEIDGFYCSRCGEHLANNYDIPSDPHDCIVCYECGEYNSCICEEIENAE